MDSHEQARIRRFRRADLDPLQRLIWETIDVSYSPVYPSRALEFFKEFHAKQRILERSGTGTLLVMDRIGELVATGSLVSGEISAVFVHPTSQGAGHGKALMRVTDRAAHLAPDDAVWEQRTRRLVELMDTFWTGENERGQLQFKSTYFTASKVDDTSRRA